MGQLLNKSVRIVCRKKSAFIPSFLGQIALAKVKLQRTSCSRGAGVFVGILNLETPFLKHNTHPLIRSRAVTSTVSGYCDSRLYSVFLSNDSHISQWLENGR